MLANSLILNFDRSTVKHGTQNIQNDCHQWLTDSFRVHQIHFRPGLRPGPHWEAYSAPPDLLAGLRGPTSKSREGGDGKGREGEKKGTGGTGPHSQIPRFAPALDLYRLEPPLM